MLQSETPQAVLAWTRSLTPIDRSFGRRRDFGGYCQQSEPSAIGTKEAALPGIEAQFQTRQAVQGAGGLGAARSHTASPTTAAAAWDGGP